MALYPIKMLKDHDGQYFFPFITDDAVLMNEDERSLGEIIEQIEQSIQDLGTVLKFCGTVATDQDLPANPSVGDVYIISSDSSERVYTQNGWETLGPLIDLSDYYTKSEVDTKDTNTLNSAKSYTDTQIAAIPQPDLSGYYTKSEVDANISTAESTAETNANSYTDTQIAAIPQPDLSNYYTKSQVSTRDTNTLTSAKSYTDSKIAAIPTSNLLHYKGHVSSVDDLPSTGQPSGTEVAPVFIPQDTYKNAWVSSLDTTTINRWNNVIQQQGYNYALAILDASGSYPSDAYVLTDYPECIDGIYIGNTSTLNWLPDCYFIHIKYDANKPVYVLRLSNMNSASYKYSVMDYDDSTQAISAIGAKLLVAKDGWFYASGLTNPHIVGNIPNQLKLKVFPKSTYYTPTSSGTAQSHTFQTVYNTMKISSYNYVDGYKFFKFITGTTQANPASFVTNETDVVENEVYTVGSTYEIYRANSTPAWEHWSSSDAKLAELEARIAALE